MNDKIIPKLLILITIVIILIFLIYPLPLNSKLQKDIFTLSYEEVSTSLTNTKSSCEKLSDCELSPGDILIRRYITPRIKTLDKLVRPYFTHSALYLGEDRIVEAMGTEKNPEDDIKINKFSESDWLNDDMINFVVIRPKSHPEKIDKIIEKLKEIADDPEYRFGIPKEGHKKATCADLILNPLLDEELANLPNAQIVITPDYLFWTLKENQDNFEIIGYNVQR